MHAAISNSQNQSPETQALPHPLSQNIAQGFPVSRRPQRRELTTEPQSLIDDWFSKSSITLGDMLSPTQREQASRLLYTWRDAFATGMEEVSPTDLIEHAIDLFPGAVPVIGKRHKYSKKERDFAAQIFPQMEEAGIIYRGVSPWGAVTLFPPRKKGSDDLRTVHNFIPINAHTIKPVYPMHNLEEVLDTLVRPDFRVFFSADATNGYWAIPIRKGDEHKAAIVTPNGQWLYRRMGMGLKGAPHTYAQFTDLVFGPLPATTETPAMKTIIRDHGEVAFSPFMDDHLGAATTFEKMFTFLHNEYFPRVLFGPVSLNPRKCNFFSEEVEVLGFTAAGNGLRPSGKHRSRVEQWPVPTCRKDVEDFIWLTPFLRIFIPGRSDHVLILKRSYQEEMTVPLSSGKTSVRSKWVEKEFCWGPEQDASFQYIKDCITSNAMAGTDATKQYHLSCDASKTGIGGVLFQLKEAPPGTSATGTIKDQIAINMFMSFKLSDVETRYTTTEREALAVVRCLAEVRWLVVGSPSPTKVYTDHTALLSTLTNGPDSHGKVSRWLDRLSEYDIEVHHRPGKSNIIQIADGFSRLTGEHCEPALRIDGERMPFAAYCLEEDVPRSSETQNGDTAGLNYTLPQELLHHPVYGDIIKFLKYGDAGIETLHRTERKAVKRKAVRFKISDRILLYQEHNGHWSRCILEEDKAAVLAWAHDCHGHYSNHLTVSKLIGEAYWPTRVSDVETHCKTCDVCQRSGPKVKTAAPQPIASFEPWKLVGMDFLGPISPAGSGGEKYILVVVCYFTKMVFIKAYESATSESVLDFWVNHLGPILGWPGCMYSDNGSHFTAHETVTMFESHGSDVVFAPISHPQSVGLAERMVQLVASQLRKWVIAKGPHAAQIWNHALSEIQLMINTRLVRTHSFCPAEMMLGFVPQWLRKPEPLQDNVGTQLHPQPLHANKAEFEAEVERQDSAQGEHWNFLWEKREEQRNRLADSIATAHVKSQQTMGKRASQKKPKKDDLVLVRNHVIDKQHGRKLESKWMGPRLITKMVSDVSAEVTNVYGDGKAKKYHVNDLKVYMPRDEETQRQARYQISGEMDYEIDVMSLDIDQRAMSFAGDPGSRFVDLSEPYIFY